MSLLGGGVPMTGDIWSTGAFSFESPLKDLLDSKDYTLEQLLAEDELLQELRGLHPVLIEYFATEKALTKLIRYITLPPSPPPEDEAGHDEKNTPENGTKTSLATSTTAAQRLNRQLEKRKSGEKTTTPGSDPEFRHIRFPFMACEIICCEIDGIVNTLVDGFVDEGDGRNEKVEGENKSAVDAPRTRLLDLFFDLLYDTQAGQLDDYRAGYFDKVLSLLFRKKGQEVSSYINTGGDRGQQSLMEAMMKHLYSHSIMQICQRLLLPPRPTPKQGEGVVEGMEQPPGPDPADGADGTPDGAADEMDDDAAVVGGQDILPGEDDDDAANGGGIKCEWSKSGIAIEMLLQRLISPETLLKEEHQIKPVSAVDNDQSIEEQRLSLSLNASEVLITVIQNSMLSSETMLSLTSFEIMHRLSVAATTLKPGTAFSQHESLLTSAMNVVESLVLQLGGYGAVGTMSILEQVESQDQETNRTLDSSTPIVQNEGQGGAEPESGKNGEIPAAASSESEGMPPAQAATDHLIADLTSLLQVLPEMLGGFVGLLRHPCTNEWKSPVQFSKVDPVQLLGTSRLRIVRVIESLVLLGDPAIDSKLVESDCLRVCLDLFWEFQWCSMLHQSVANLLVHVFEGQNARFEIQSYFISSCNLIGRLMNSFVEVTDPRVHSLVMDLGKVVDGQSPPEMKDDPGPSPDVLPVSEDDIDAAMEKQDEENKGAAPPVVDNVDVVSTEAVHQESRDASTVGVTPPAQSFRFGYMGHVIIICQALVQACAGNEWAAEQEAEELAQQHAEGGDVSEPPSVTGVLSNDATVKTGGTAFEPLMIAELVNNHDLAERWQDFVISTLASEIAVQSTPLGGLNAQPSDPLQSHRPEGLAGGRRPGLADDGDVGDGDGAIAPPPPRGMITASEINELDDSDLEAAANMMAGLNLGRPSPDDGSDGSAFSGSAGSGDSERTYNSGETANSGGYLFDDPLGKAAGSLGIELGKLTQYRSDKGGANPNDDSDDDNSSSDEEPAKNDDEEVPVMDLFAGNFNNEGGPVGEQQDGASFDFANFENAFDGGGGGEADAFGEFTSAPPADTSPEVVNAEDIFGSGSSGSLLDNLDDIPPEPETPASSETPQDQESETEPPSSEPQQDKLPRPTGLTDSGGPPGTDDGEEPPAEPLSAEKTAGDSPQKEGVLVS